MTKGDFDQAIAIARNSASEAPQKDKTAQEIAGFGRDVCSLLKWPHAMSTIQGRKGTS